MDSINFINRETREICKENIPSVGMLKWLYNKPCGKLTLNLLFKRKFISAFVGNYMSSKKSIGRIENFVKEHHIDLTECEKSEVSKFKHFNDFFYRKLKPGIRTIEKGVVSPADGKILVFKSLSDSKNFFVKGEEFTLDNFLRNEELSNKYKEGAMAIIRLAPADYHRYHFPAEGIPSATKKIKGFYYSVSPIALKKSLRIFCENKREYCELKTKEYGDIAFVDVGATMVGSMTQTYIPNTQVKSGDEKGYFSFGGSTVVLFFEKGKVQFAEDLITNTQNGYETTIKMGENIANAL